MDKPEFNDSLEHVLIAIRDAAAIAIAENKALGLPITYIRDNQLIEEQADGTIKVLKDLPPKLPTRIYKKGETFKLNPDG